MTLQVTLYQNDYVRYKVDQGTYQTGEVLELDIPHPTSKKDKQIYVRVLTDVGPKLTTRTEIEAVLCPKCHPTGRPIELGLLPEPLFHELEQRTGPVTNRQGLKEIRRFRYCEHCQYFKEA